MLVLELKGYPTIKMYIPSSSMIVIVVEFDPLSVAKELVTFTSTMKSSSFSTLRSPTMVMFWQPVVFSNGMVSS